MDDISVTIFDNAILFLNRAIIELINQKGEKLDRGQAIFTCLFIQTALELGIKTHLIRTESIYSILLNKYHNEPQERIKELFEIGELKTKNFDDLKKQFFKLNPVHDEKLIDCINLFQTM